MRWTRLSFFYLIGYLSLGGLGLLFAPDLALRLLGATTTYPPVLARFVGAFMVALAIRSRRSYATDRGALPHDAPSGAL